MIVNYNVKRKERKLLAQTIGKAIGVDAIYKGVPTCAYEIDYFTIEMRNMHSAVSYSASGLSETITSPPGRSCSGTLPDHLHGKAVCRMNAKIIEQILAVRDTGLTNMFDVTAVQRIAFDMELYELVTWLEDHKQEYSSFILFGRE